jgi:hypothetical protein
MTKLREFFDTDIKLKKMTQCRHNVDTNSEEKCNNADPTLCHFFTHHHRHSVIFFNTDLKSEIQ